MRVVPPKIAHIDTLLLDLLKEAVRLDKLCSIASLRPEACSTCMQ